MSFISKEIPGGVINGINTTFILSQNIFQIDDIFIDGAIYLGVVTVVGNQILLADAPTVSIYVDYFTAAPDPPVADEIDFVTLQDYVCQELKISSGGTEAYPIDTIKRLLNEGYSDIFNQPRKNLYLREESVAFNTVPDAALTQQVNPGDVTINVVSTTGYPTAGVILLGTNFITYSGLTATTFTGCSNVVNTSLTDVVVRCTYSLATLFPNMDEQQERILMIDELEYVFQAPSIFLSLLNNNNLYFTIFNKRLILPFSNIVQKGYLHYFKKIILMILDTDTPAVLPNTYRYMLAFYAIGRALILDDLRTGWDKYYNYNPLAPQKSSGLYFDWLRNLYGKFGRRVDATNTYANSVWD